MAHATGHFLSIRKLCGCQRHCIFVLQLQAHNHICWPRIHKVKPLPTDVPLKDPDSLHDYEINNLVFLRPGSAIAYWKLAVKCDCVKMRHMFLVLVRPLRAVYSYNCYMLRSETSFISDLWGSTNVTLVVKGAQVSTNNQLAINFKFETSIWFWTHLPLYSTFHFVVGWTWALLVVVAAESGNFLGNGAILPQE